MPACLPLPGRRWGSQPYSCDWDCCPSAFHPAHIPLLCRAHAAHLLRVPRPIFPHKARSGQPFCGVKSGAAVPGPFPIAELPLLPLPLPWEAAGASRRKRAGARLCQPHNCAAAEGIWDWRPCGNTRTAVRQGTVTLTFPKLLKASRSCRMGFGMKGIWKAIWHM